MIVITGMHRSGTSFTSKLLHGLDVDFGEYSSLAEADHWNPKGYYENIDLQILHDKIVIGDFYPAKKFRNTSDTERSFYLKLVMSVGRTRYMFFSAKDVARRARKHQAEMRHLADSFADVAVKDPRFSFTIKEWAKYVKISKVLYCYRHPYEVALSLQKRYHFPTMIGMALWAHHIDEFFRQASGLRIVIINYNNFFHEQSRLTEIQRLYHFLEKPYNDQEARQLLEVTLDSTLRRNTVNGHQRIPPSVEKLYAMLHHYHERYNDLKVFQPEG